jgi:hypothetical protein
VTGNDALHPGAGEDLRRALEWLVEQPQRDARTIEEASQRFNLSPLDEAFLLEHFRRERSTAGSRDRR